MSKAAVLKLYSLA